MINNDAGLATSGRLLFISAFVLMMGVLADQATKSWATSGAVEPRILVPGYLAAYSVMNAGALLGYGGEHTRTSTTFAVLGIILFGRLAWIMYQDRRRWQGVDWVPIALLLAGIVGNTLDRLALGHVRDFLVIWAVPTVAFNVADVLILVGAIALPLTRIYRDQIGRNVVRLGPSL